MSKIQAVILPKLKPKNKPYTLSDGNGLALLVKTDAKKLWECFF